MMKNFCKNQIFSSQKLVASALVLVFLLSLTIHNHPFFAGSHNVNSVLKADATGKIHPLEICPACTVGKNITDTYDNLVSSLNIAENLVAVVSHNDLVFYSFLNSKKTSRSPPSV